MSPTRSPKGPFPEKALSTDVERDVHRAILRLVKSGPEREAIEAGQVDAVVDPASGRALLLPEAQRALNERSIELLERCGLSFDWYWKQDDQFRFVPSSLSSIQDLVFADASILGKTLWELSIENLTESEWRTHRQQLAWRAEFRDLEIRRVGRDGQLQFLAISGTPILDDANHFTGYRGIARDLTARRRSEIAAQSANRYESAAFGALTQPVGILDGNGVLCAANVAWRVFATTHMGAGTNVAQGTSYLADLDDASGSESIDATAIAAGIRQVLFEGREVFRYEQCCVAIRGAAGPRWSELCVSRVAELALVGATIAREDITERVRAQQLQGVENAVARCLLASDDAGGGLKMVIRVICEAYGWQCGRYFDLDQVSGMLRFRDSWGNADADTERFLEKSDGLAFRAGAGLAGRVSQTGQPLWVVEDGRGKVVSPSALSPETGREGAFAFPATFGEEIVGVLAFSGRMTHEPDDRLLQAVRSIGRDIGYYLRQVELLGALRQREERFRRLTMLASDWYWEQDTEFQFTQCVGIGPFADGSALAKSIWELPGVTPARGDWTTHISQLKAQWSYSDFELTVALADGELAHYVISGEPIYNETGRFVGYRGTGLDITERVRQDTGRVGEARSIRNPGRSDK